VEKGMLRLKNNPGEDNYKDKSNTKKKIPPPKSPKRKMIKNPWIWKAYREVSSSYQMKSLT